MMQSMPRITFGIIVLNGEPFTRYNLAALYPFAHQIIVVEGAAPAASAFATPQGHSLDQTLETIQRFQKEEDPDGKVLLVTAEDEGHADGFWMEKDEMSQAYAKRATGDYLWQVDMDEFYRADEMRRIIEALQNQPEIQAVTFQVRTFWGGLQARTDGIFLRRGAQNFHRLFAWRPGYRYVTHRPPTVVDAQGRDLRTTQALSGADTARMGIFLYHYSFVFPFQVRFKRSYYGRMDQDQQLPLQKERQQWHDNYFRLRHPFCIDDTSILGEPSWLVRFRGKHPEAVMRLWADIDAGKIVLERRPVDDIDRLLAAPWYATASRLLPVLWMPAHWAQAALRRLGRRIRRGR